MLLLFGFPFSPKLVVAVVEPLVISVEDVEADVPFNLVLRSATEELLVATVLVVVLSSNLVVLY